MDTDLDKEVKEIKEKNDAEKLEKAKLEERVNNFEKEQEKIMNEIKEKNINIDDIENITEKAKTEVIDLIKEAKKILGLINE